MVTQISLCGWFQTALLWGFPAPEALQACVGAKALAWELVTLSQLPLLIVTMLRFLIN